MSVLAEVRTLLERAAAGRLTLEGLIAAVPADYWERRGGGDAWAALDHLRHVATIDVLVIELVEVVAEPGTALWVGGTRDAEVLDARRVALMAGLQGREIDELRAAMRRSRAAAVEALLALTPAALEREVRVAGVTTPWGEPRAFALRAWLAHWAAHDGEHERAIRRAVETPPDAATLTLAAGRGRRAGRAR